MKTLKSKKLIIAVIGILAGLAIAFGVKPDDVTTISGALVVIITVTMHLITQGKIDAASATSALNAAETIVKTVAPESNLAQIPDSAISEAVGTAAAAAETIATALPDTSAETTPTPEAVEDSHYAVLYYANGTSAGTVPVDITAYTAGQIATVLGNTGGLARDGYIFDGWNTAADGSGTRCAAGASIPVNATVTLYAIWTASTVTL